jgi:deoxycytidylate deaminase
MNSVLKSVPPSKPNQGNQKKTANDEIATLRSEELVIALAGPIGSGAALVREEIEQALRDRGYRVVLIKVSGLIADSAAKASIDIAAPETGSPEFQRIHILQTQGNALRRILGDDAGAQLAIDAISTDRSAENPNVELAELLPPRVAYIVDQLKHPREAILLRHVYGSIFFLVGLLCGYDRRKRNLSANMTAEEAVKLIERDKAESDQNGQQLEKALKLADYFLRNTHQNSQLLKKAVRRFVGLVHADSGITPTRSEYGMAAAYSASLKSACLSRQVGAAILDRHGNLVSTGCNDVPRAGGGLYESPLSTDHRCVFRDGGRCFNDQRKDMLRDDIAKALVKEGLPQEQAKRYAEVIRSNTGLKDLIEFSRAVHAEMDAIVRVARNGGQSVKDSFLFTTTYPCHNCARHIVASGIRAVYFIEPYEKSLAATLHDDAIEHDPELEPTWDATGEPTKVAFVHFEGVAPIRFDALFSARESRKDKFGKAIRPESNNLNEKKDSVFVGDYMDLEAKIVRRLHEHLS